MDGQLPLTLLHEVGPKWACIILAGVWFWRCTPWFGKQLEKLIDCYVGKRRANGEATASEGAK